VSILDRPDITQLSCKICKEQFNRMLLLQTELDLPTSNK